MTNRNKKPGGFVKTPRVLSPEEAAIIHNAPVRTAPASLVAPTDAAAAPVVIDESVAPAASVEPAAPMAAPETPAPVADAVPAVAAPAAAVEPVSPAAAPWDDISGLMTKGVNLPMHPTLYLKMVWICKNIPQMSLQKIAKQGTEELVNRLIAEHYKP